MARCWIFGWRVRWKLSSTSSNTSEGGKWGFWKSEAVVVLGYGSGLQRMSGSTSGSWEVEEEGRGPSPSPPSPPLPAAVSVCKEEGESAGSFTARGLVLITVLLRFGFSISKTSRSGRGEPGWVSGAREEGEGWSSAGGMEEEEARLANFGVDLPGYLDNLVEEMEAW